MTDLESEIKTLRELDTLRIQSGKLRDEGIDALTALCSPLFCIGDIRDVPSLIRKQKSDSTPSTKPVSQFVWGKFSATTTQLLVDPDSTLPQQEFALIQELNNILRGNSMYEPTRFAEVNLRPGTMSLVAQKPMGDLLIYLNRRLLEDTYAQIPSKLDDTPNVSIALWKLSSAPPENLKELMGVLENLELRVIVDSPVAILLAAVVMKALIAAPSSTFTQPLLYCYYLIIRELYTMDAPDWAVGGARANHKNGTVSAFMTRECARALLSLIRALENTGNFIAELSEIQKRADQLKRMKTQFPELNIWVSAEEARVKFALQTTTQGFSRRLVLHPPEFDRRSITIEAYVAKLASQLKETTKNAKEAFKKALEAIDLIRNEELSESKDGEDEISKFGRAQAGHLIAESALKRGQQKAGSILEILTPVEWYKDFKEWKKLEKEVKKISMPIRGLLRPVKKFLSSVLDRELAAAAGGSYGEWDVIEMACAAAAYGAVTNEWGDDRLRCVVDSLKKVISDRGRFPIARPFHVYDKEGACHPYNIVV